MSQTFRTSMISKTHLLARLLSARLFTYGWVVLGAAIGMYFTYERGSRAREAEIRAARDIPAFTILADDSSLYLGSTQAFHSSSLQCAVTTQAIERGARITSRSVVVPHECVRGWLYISIRSPSATIAPGDQVMLVGLRDADTTATTLDCRSILLAKTDSTATFAVRPSRATAVAAYLGTGKQVVVLNTLDHPYLRRSTPVSPPTDCSDEKPAPSAQKASANRDSAPIRAGAP